jgi:hypothetical protein
LPTGGTLNPISVVIKKKMQLIKKTIDKEFLLSYKQIVFTIVSYLTLVVGVLVTKLGKWKANGNGWWQAV